MSSRQVDKELGYSKKEFVLTLNKQTIFSETKLVGDSVEIAFEQGVVKIHFMEESERCIASMRMPLLKVKMELVELDEAQEKRFFQLFLRAFQKGGG